MNNSTYDSTVDTRNHIEKLQKIANQLILPELTKRFENHDKSKLVNPERDGYNYYVPLLKKVKYGTPEYFNIKDKMSKDCFGHHAAMNSHHPEHYENGINGMDLFDIIEMMTDWYTASLNSDTGFEKGLESNVKRFNIDPQLESILKNTYERYYKQIGTDI